LFVPAAAIWVDRLEQLVTRFLRIGRHPVVAHPPVIKAAE
jgi:hypothetical protein